MKSEFWQLNTLQKMSNSLIMGFAVCYNNKNFLGLKLDKILSLQIIVLRGKGRESWGMLLNYLHPATARRL